MTRCTSAIAWQMRGPNELRKLAVHTHFRITNCASPSCTCTNRVHASDPILFANGPIRCLESRGELYAQHLSECPRPKSFAEVTAGRHDLQLPQALSSQSRSLDAHPVEPLLALMLRARCGSRDHVSPGSHWTGVLQRACALAMAFDPARQYTAVSVYFCSSACSPGLECSLGAEPLKTDEHKTRQVCVRRWDLAL